MEAKELKLSGQETERLYDKNSHLKEFGAVVLSCEKKETINGAAAGYRVVLDRTAFFPEGGGQFGDRGWLGETEVTDTREK